MAIIAAIFVSVVTGQSEDKFAETQTPLQKELAKFDKNKDGKLDVEEQAAYFAAQSQKRADYIKKYDKNGDGKLDEDERLAARAAEKQALAEARKAEKEAKAQAKASTGPNATPKP